MNMNVREILENITKEHASDIFVVAGRPPVSYTHLDVYKRQIEWQKKDHRIHDSLLRFLKNSQIQYSSNHNK